MDIDTKSLLEPAVDIAVAAGKDALKFYGKDGPVEYKSDNSPLTLADKASHETIVRALRERTPEIPILSEESPEEDKDRRKEWECFWLVDPLDGSKEFIKRSGQFTVNIALVQGTETILGVVHVPVSGVTYTGLPVEGTGGGGAWVRSPGEEEKPIRARAADLEHLTVVASKDHAGPIVEAFLARLSGAEVTSMGSSLKFCLVAEGKADFYPRVVPTMEWDTGAAQCIVEAAGGRVTDLDGERLRYNKESLRNPSLMAIGDRDVDWVGFFSSERDLSRPDGHR